MINLMYCGNKGVFDGTLISLLSIAKNTKESLNVFIITMTLIDIDKRFIGISEQQVDYIENAIKEYNEDSKVTLVDVSQKFRNELINSVNISSSYTPYTLLRLFADDINEIPNKIIYIDADTMANGDIALLFNTDISEYEFGGVVDYLGRWFISKSYINAGVLLLNIHMIRKTGLFKKCRTLCNDKKMSFPDQTAINNLAEKKLYLPEKFNSQRRLYDDTVIQHFSKSIRWIPFFHTINIKPWEVDKVRSKLKINAYDNILNEYLKRKLDKDWPD